MTLLETISIGKNIMVYDVAADSSGALSVLRDFYKDVKDKSDKNIKWLFIVSKPEFDETDNIKVLRYPWIKKSWLHRLYFDYFIAPRIVKQHGVDAIFSLQNMTVPVSGIRQIVYLHQPLPFSEYKFNIFESPLFWTYQNIISRFIFRSIKKAVKVIVQTHWMKDACVTKTGVDENKIEVIPPVIDIKPKDFFVPTKESCSTFFYPATPYKYKNHKLIIEACKLLIINGITDYKVIFTLTGKENRLSQKLYRETCRYHLPIQFIGQLSRDEVFDWYAKSVLLFPSYIETFGLPLLEACMHVSPIIAFSTKFAREILDYYENKYWIFNAAELSHIMSNSIKGEA